MNPPSAFSILPGSFENDGPVLKREYNKEEINVSVLRLVDIVNTGGDGADDDSLNQLFLHVKTSKPDQPNALHFLCALYPDTLGIHAVHMRPKAEEDPNLLEFPNKYNGPTFQELDEKMKDALHGYVEERGVNESLFPFLQAWLYVKDHRKLMQWFKSVGDAVVETERAVYDDDSSDDDF